MTAQPSTSAAITDLEQALADLTAQTPALGEIIAAFAPLKIAQAGLREGLPELGEPMPPVDAARLAQGVPLAQVEDFLNLPALDLAAYLERAAAVVLPALAQGMPNLRPGLEALGQALTQQTLPAQAALQALLAGQQAQVEKLALDAGLSPDVLAFAMLEVIRPVLQRRAQALADALPAGAWNHGQCPICGSLPEMAFMQGEGGQRWLRCSLCGHHWRFARTACPVCGNQDQDRLGFFYAEGRQRERVDSCQQCGKYLVTLDARGLDRQPLWEVAALGLVYLDLLAQEQGLLPAAWCAWNLVK